jgi:hypothetical protein
MPDQYMNLTDAEAAELGYRIPPGPRRRRAEGPDEFPLSLALSLCVSTLIVFIVLLATHVSTGVKSSAGLASPAPPGGTASTSAASSPQSPMPQPSGETKQGTTLPSQAKDEQPITPREYLPDGWDWGVSANPIHLYGGQEVIAILSPGTEFLRSWYTTNGWSFVIALDGVTRGWAYLTPLMRQRIEMDSKFEKALIRARIFDAIRNAQTRVVYQNEAPGSIQQDATRENVNNSAAAASTFCQSDEVDPDRQLLELFQTIVQMDNGLHRKEQEQNVALYSHRQRRSA